MIKSVFRNELGNEILIIVKDGPKDGFLEHVSVEVIGPSSQIESILTREEALQIKELLTKYFVSKTIE